MCGGWWWWEGGGRPQVFVFIKSKRATGSWLHKDQSREEENYAAVQVEDRECRVANTGAVIGSRREGRLLSLLVFV